MKRIYVIEDDFSKKNLIGNFDLTDQVFYGGSTSKANNCSLSILCIDFSYDDSTISNVCSAYKEYLASRRNSVIPEFTSISISNRKLNSGRRRLVVIAQPDDIEEIDDEIVDILKDRVIG